ncbi:hypothetical protein G7085_03175 [Tessaracoccus sp. HDW20]|uniref:hypothetical protein n=1 Tax=Tessaracoccus coleopterorum TaxID=2714950 RepID=UPI0018D4D37D|nr:hypothetical protein [Tessaracoccus coleopterorum]NHB84003.1 hypothetical protein [Tessaracoccus coleopterorum]
MLRYVTDEAMAAIQSLTGQEYVDVYALRVKSGDLTPSRRTGSSSSGPGRRAPVIEPRAPRAEA